MHCCIISLNKISSPQLQLRSSTVGKQMKAIITDDLDGKELPESTEPVRMTWGSVSWDLFLSDKNQDKINEVITGWTQNAETVRPIAANPAATRKRNKSAGPSLSDLDVSRTEFMAHPAVKAWEQQAGKSIGDRGRVPVAAIEAYQAAQAPKSLG